MESSAGTTTIGVLVTEDVKSGDGDPRHVFSDRIVRGATHSEILYVMRRLGLVPHPVLDSPPRWR